MERIAFVTGGNRGIGFEACRQLALAGEQVVVASRRAGAGRAAAAELASSGLAVEAAQLDVALPESISRFAAGGGRVVNGSTGMAQLDDVDGGYALRHVSKTAQNALTA